MIAQIQCPLLKAHAAARWNRFSPSEQKILREQFVELEKYHKKCKAETKRMERKAVSDMKKAKRDKMRNKSKKNKRSTQKKANQAKPVS